MRKGAAWLRERQKGNLESEIQAIKGKPKF